MSQMTFLAVEAHLGTSVTCNSYFSSSQFHLSFLLFHLVQNATELCASCFGSVLVHHLIFVLRINEFRFWSPEIWVVFFCEPPLLIHPSRKRWSDYVLRFVLRHTLFCFWNYRFLFIISSAQLLTFTHAFFHQL